MNQAFADRIGKEMEEIRAAGLFKTERIITSEQGAEIVVNGKTVLNFCANNYLGLSSHPAVIEAAHRAIDTHGYGMSSVRFICGTQDIHKELEEKIARFLGTEDTILYAAAFDANGGVFEPLFGEQDAIISDALNHASIIDGVRLCKAQRLRYEHNNMQDLETKLKESAACRSRVIVTDGSFSMDGTIAQLDKICALADKYDAIVMICLRAVLGAGFFLVDPRNRKRSDGCCAFGCRIICRREMGNARSRKHNQTQLGKDTKARHNGSRRNGTKQLDEVALA